MTWEPELEELRRREELARQMGGEERVARQHAGGRLTVRERIDRLFDPDTFHETGAIAGQATYGDNGELDAFFDRLDRFLAFATTELGAVPRTFREFRDAHVGAPA